MQRAAPPCPVPRAYLRTGLNQIFSSSTPGFHGGGRGRADDLGVATRAAQTTALRPAAGMALRTLANLEIRPDELQLFVDGRRANLTGREFELLLVLAERVDMVVQRPEIYEQVWAGRWRGAIAGSMSSCARCEQSFGTSPQTGATSTLTLGSAPAGEDRSRW